MDSSNTLVMGMGNGELLNIQPTELKFPFELGKTTSCCLQLTNKTDDYVAFKVKTKNPKQYCVCPNTGIVLPGTTCLVTVTKQAQKDLQCDDKFLIESVTAPKGVTTPEMFKKQSGKVIELFKLRASYLSYVAATSDGDNGSQGTSLFDTSSNPLLTSMSCGDLLNIHPTELQFPFELYKRSSCLLRLTNKTGEYVAFKVKMTNPESYYVYPNIGIVLPETTCDVTVRTMRAQEEAPEDMQCKHKFNIQSITAPKGVITPEMFNKKIGKDVKEYKMAVIYAPAPKGATRKDFTPELVDNESRKLVKEFEVGVINVPVDPVVPEGTSLFDAEKKPSGLQKQIKNMNKEKNIPGKVLALLNKAKTKVGRPFGLFSREKAIMAGDVNLCNKEKLILEREKTKLETDVELLNKEKAKLQSDKDRLQTDIELLKKEKDILQTAIHECGNI